MVYSTAIASSAGPSGKRNRGEDEIITNVETSSRQRTRRLYWSIGACLVALLIIIICILAPILTLQNADRSASRMNVVEERAAANEFSREFRNDLMAAASATYTVAGFVTGKMKTAPPFNASIPERVEGQYLDGFESIVHHANSTGSLQLMLLAPGGVIYQAVPPSPELLMEDTLNSPYGPNSGFNLGSVKGKKSSHVSVVEADAVGATTTTTHPPSGSTDCSMVNWPSPFESVRCGGVSVLGPTRVVADALIGADWYMNLRFPLFLSMNPANSSTANFWGFVYCALSITRSVESSNLAKALQERNMHYLMYTRLGDYIIPITTSLSPNCSQKELRTFLDRATSQPVIPSTTVSWLIAVESTRNERRVNVRTVLIIALSGILGTLLLLAVALGLICRATAEYNGRHYAPRSTPFALLTVGAYNSKELWDLAADEMVAVTDRLSGVLENAMVDHKAYRIQQMHPFTTSYVLSHAETAVAMCFDILEEIQRDRIDGPLVRLLGEEERLMLSFALHWCEDASVVVKEGRPLHYSGPDVLFNARMWVFAAPNTVTLSSAAQKQLNMHRARLGKGVRIRFLNSVFLRGVRSRQDLFNATDESNERVREAAQIATARVRRLRAAQQQRGQEDGGPRSSASGRDFLVAAQTLEDGVKPARGTVPRASDSGGTRTHRVLALADPLAGSVTAPPGGSGGGGSGLRTSSSCATESVSPASVRPIAVTPGACVVANHPGGSSATRSRERGAGAGSGGRPQLRQTRTTTPSLSHPLLYHHQSLRDSGHDSAASSRSHSCPSHARSSASWRSVSSHRSSTDDGTDTVVHGAVTSRRRDVSSCSSSGRSPVEEALLAANAVGREEYLTGQVSGGVVVRSSLRAGAAGNSSLSSSLLADTATTMPLAFPLHAEPPSRLLDGGATTDHTTSVVVASAAEGQPVGESFVSVPARSSLKSPAPETLAGRSASEVVSEGKAKGSVGVEPLRDPCVPTRQGTETIFVGDGTDAPPVVTTSLPATVTVRADGRFMIAPPLVKSCANPRVGARPLSGVHQSPPLPLLTVVPPRERVMLSPTTAAPTTRHAFGDPYATMPVSSLLQPALPDEAVLSLVSSTSSAGRHNSVPRSQQPHTRSTHHNPLALESSQSSERVPSGAAAVHTRSESGDNPLSGGGAAALTSLSPLFPVVMGASVRHASSTGSGSVSRTASGLQPGSPAVPSTAPQFLAPTVACAVDTTPSAGGAAPARSPANSYASSTAVQSAGRRGQSHSRTTNAGANTPFTTSSAAHGSDLVVPLLRAITHPAIADWLDQELRDSFEQQAIALDVSYDSLRIIIYYVYYGCKLIVRPLSAAQRTSIYRRLVGNQGVPQQKALVYLSTRCVIQFVQQHEEQHSLLWDRQLQQEQIELQSKIQ